LQPREQECASLRLSISSVHSHTYIDFQPILDLPVKHQDAAAQVLKFSGRYVEASPDQGLIFSWTDFLQALKSLTGDDLTFDEAQNQSINQQEATVDIMVQKIVDFLKKVLNVVIDVSALAARIESTFTNLKTEATEGFLQFQTHKDSKNTSWEYRVLFAVDPHPENPDANRFYSLVTTIEIGADITEETGWWGLTSDTKKNFYANITGLELVVKDSFKAPAKTA
jgi:hypothetical protein